MIYLAHVLSDVTAALSQVFSGITNPSTDDAQKHHPA